MEDQFIGNTTTTSTNNNRNKDNPNRSGNSSQHCFSKNTARENRRDKEDKRMRERSPSQAQGSPNKKRKLDTRSQLSSQNSYLAPYNLLNSIHSETLSHTLNHVNTSQPVPNLTSTTPSINSNFNINVNGTSTSNSNTDINKGTPFLSNHPPTIASSSSSSSTSLSSSSLLSSSSSSSSTSSSSSSSPSPSHCQYNNSHFQETTKNNHSDMRLDRKVDGILPEILAGMNSEILQLRERVKFQETLLFQTNAHLSNLEQLIQRQTELFNQFMMKQNQQSSPPYSTSSHQPSHNQQQQQQHASQQQNTSPLCNHQQVPMEATVPSSNLIQVMKSNNISSSISTSTSLSPSLPLAPSSSSSTPSNLSDNQFIPRWFRLPTEYSKPISIWDKTTLTLIGCNEEFRKLCQYDYDTLKNNFKIFKFIPSRIAPFGEVFLYALLNSGARYSQIKSIWISGASTEFYNLFTFHLEESFFWIEHTVLDMMDDEFVVENLIYNKTYQIPYCESTGKSYIPPAKRIYTFLEMINRVSEHMKNKQHFSSSK